MQASAPLMAPTQKEECRGDKGLGSLQTRNSGSFRHAGSRAAFPERFRPQLRHWSRHSTGDDPIPCRVTNNVTKSVPLIVAIHKQSHSTFATMVQKWSRLCENSMP